MQISLRSQLIAGTAAIVGAGAIAMNPVAPALTLPSITVPSVAQVALAGFDNPLSELILTTGVLNTNIFDGTNLYGDYEWEPYVGIVPEFIYTALPLISQLGFNGSAYIGGSIDALGTSAYVLSEAVWNLPGAVVTAAQQAIGGDIAGAITTLTNATLVPIQTAGTTALGALISVVTGVVTNVTNVVGVLPGIAAGLVTTAVGSASALVNAVVNIVTQTLGALATLDVETAWNTVVDGLLGPVGADGFVTSSVPGTLLAVTVGPGLGPLGFPNGYAVRACGCGLSSPSCRSPTRSAPAIRFRLLPRRLRPLRSPPLRRRRSARPRPQRHRASRSTGRWPATAPVRPLLTAAPTPAAPAAPGPRVTTAEAPPLTTAPVRPTAVPVRPLRPPAPATTPRPRPRSRPSSARSVSRRRPPATRADPRQTSKGRPLPEEGGGLCSAQILFRNRDFSDYSQVW